MQLQKYFQLNSETFSAENLPDYGNILYSKANVPGWPQHRTIHQSLQGTQFTMVMTQLHGRNQRVQAAASTSGIATKPTKLSLS